MRKTTLLLIACLLLMGALPSQAASAKKGVNAADDPGPAGAAGACFDAVAVGLLGQRDVDVRQRQWMTERDQIGGAFGRHDAG